MKGFVPKPASLRQRRNRSVTRAMLPSPEQSASNDIPPLPKRSLILRGRPSQDDVTRKRAGKWHPAVVEWWASIWRSPMAGEYLETDKHGLYMLAELYQDFWTAMTWKDRLGAAVEIRQQGSRFGISPIDRRRLQWEVERGEQATERTERRQQQRHAQGKDPRDLLKVEK